MRRHWAVKAIKMFRRLPNRLPPDVSFPADLKELGYFINDQDQFRQIKNPGQKYQYKMNRNERVNDVYKEAMNSKIANGSNLYYWWSLCSMYTGRGNETSSRTWSPSIVVTSWHHSRRQAYPNPCVSRHCQQETHHSLYWRATQWSGHSRLSYHWWRRS